MVHLCLTRRDGKISEPLANELRTRNIAFQERVDELEEYLYLCLATTKRAKDLEDQELKKMRPSHLILCLILFYIIEIDCVCADPIDGFTIVPLTESNFEIQKPYDKLLEGRYSFTDGIRRLWVYADDRPHEPDSKTMPRTEIRIRGLDYSSGVWQFEGYGFVPNGTSGAIVLQIHGGMGHATTLILRMYEGDIRYYLHDLIATNLYDKWFRVNVIHNRDQGIVEVYLDGTLKLVTQDRGPGDLYFKCGVYAAPPNVSYYMESRWKDIKIYKK
ncbi:hypothetical protein ACJRO7_026030 [Eucalyptus globulus]|uniref:Alginate lyase 2 domain-containing protein n=1 Tax=Eucalyptus globulus TaxID=34317 RepID=A0ABD3KEM1_EUCGL